MNYKIILLTLGRLLSIEGFFLLISALVSLLYGENDFPALLYSGLITITIGLVSMFIYKTKDKNFGKREGYIIVSAVWIIFSLFGALPFVLSGAIPSYTDAFFETMSGFTTTGASILNDIESMQHGLLLWRSITQWLGGMGIIVLSLAILPLLGIGGMQLFIAEVPGPTPDKLHPKIKETAKRLWGIYAVFTLIEAILLLFGGMTVFDAINHALTTMATGGYSTKNTSIAFYDSPYIHYVIIVFMFLAGTNFTLSYLGIKLKFRKIFENEEFRYYIGFIAAFTIIATLILIFSLDYGVERAFRDSLFQVVSIITTTGYVTADYLLWTPFLIMMIFVLMFFGGSAGSTGGGIKIIRVVLLIKNSYMELKRLIHPHAVIPTRINGRSVDQTIMTNVLAFIVIYVLVFVTGTVLMSTQGMNIESSMGAVAATVGNIGPGIGSVGPTLNFAGITDLGKWILSFCMLIGRLELFTVIVLLSPAFWRK